MWITFLTQHWKKMYSSTATSETSENVFLLFVTSFVSFEVYVKNFLDAVRNTTTNRKCKLELIKRRSKVHQNNLTGEHILNFNQWKTLSENYKPIKVWLWFIYKIAEKNCLRLFIEFIQTHNRHIASPDKISILTWKMLVISSQSFSCNLNLSRTLLSK